MSEFTETMKQAKRVCQFYKNCSICPLHEDTEHFGGSITYDCALQHFCISDMDLLEAKILNWVKEHPEDIYPSWEDGWKEAFPNANTDCLCPKNFFGISLPYCKTISCELCIKHPMEEKVAQVLHILPRTNDNKRYNFSKNTWEEKTIIL